MATTTKGRPGTAGKRRGAAAPHPDATTVSLPKRIAQTVAEHAPRLALADRLQREVLGAGLVVLALLSAWALARGDQDGRLIAWWRDVLVAAYGAWGGWLVPVFLVLVSARVFRDIPGPILQVRHFIGGFGFAIAVVGLLQLQADNTGDRPGGNLGLGVAAVVLDALGEVAGGFALFAIGVISVFLLADMTFGRFVSEVRAVTPPLDGLKARLRRDRGDRVAVAHEGDEWDDDDLDDDNDDLDDPDALPATRRRRFRSVRPASRADLVLPVLATPSSIPAPFSGSIAVLEDEADADDSGAVEPLDSADVLIEEPEDEPETLTPVINVPQRKAKPERNAKKKAIQPLARAKEGELLPLPDIEMLPYYEAYRPNEQDLERRAKLIEEKLASFRVEARVREINTGPAVTQFALEPGEGVKVRRITELQNDLALALAAPQIRIEAPVPGMARVGIEVPNDHVMTVGLRETLESSAFTRGKQKLPIPLGLDVNGKYIVHDLVKMPHLLIAGATGSGKSVCLNGIISTFLLTRRPDEVKLVMIDPKMVELTGYNGVPHLQCPVITEMDKVVPALRLVLREMERRYALFSRLGVRNLEGYRMKIADEPDAEKLPYLVVIIDELADLMMTTPDEVESLLQRLTQMARATGIHLIIATQRPSVDVITGIIKANVPARIAFMVSSGTDSRVIIDGPGAERLLGRGDMLFVPPDAPKPMRIQGVFVSDEDVQQIVGHWHAVTPVPHYAQEWLDLPSTSSESGGDHEWDEDPLWEQALDIVRKQGTASASMLQRRLRVGYNRAARMIQQMEDEGIIGPPDGLRGRPVLIGHDDDD